MKYSNEKNLPPDQVLALYCANNWSSADKPEALISALRNSHSVVSAWDGSKLVGLANAISDGFLVVYYPHLLVLPEYWGRGVGKTLMNLMRRRYDGFHMQMLTADRNAVGFYRKCDFERAGQTVPMWIYSGDDH